MDLSLNGPQVHACRIEAGLTVAALADRLGVHADVIWAIEKGDERQLEQLPVVTLVSLANSLDLRPSQLFADTAVPSRAPPTPDDVVLEAALLEHGSTVTCEDLALAFGWPLVRIEHALAGLHQRLRLTGTRLHPAGVNSYVIAPNRSALTPQQWIRLGHARGAREPLRVAAATVLFHLITLQISLSSTTLHRRSALSTWRTDDWDDSDDALRHLRDQQLLDQNDLHARPNSDVYYSLGLTD